jgi:hypothetical protein
LTEEQPGPLPQIQSGPPRLPPGRAIDQINVVLSAEASLKGFLPAAENSLLAASEDFTGTLGIEAIRIAEHRRATAVDRQDVLDADKKLRGSLDPEKRGWRLGVGGFMGGGAVTALVAVLLAPKPVHHATYWILSIVVLSVAALALFLTSYPREKGKH